jgi:CheY-like chemotaxis protein
MSPKQILIIEDDAEIRATLKDLFDSVGYSTALAVQGQDAMTQLEAGLEPKLALVDMMMPIMDGAQFCAAIRAHARFKTLPLYIVTASGMTQTRAKELGAEGFLAKPVKVEALLELVERYVGPP